MKNTDFVTRFTEICGTSQPGIACQKLGISYQAAKNYLGGRFPDSQTLVYISRKTSYSIHWLLTGEGKKFVELEQNIDTTLLTDEMRAFIRQECLEIINEMLRSGYEQIAAQKVVVLNSNSIKDEKVTEGNSVNFSTK